MVATLVLLLLELSDGTATILSRKGARGRACCLEGPVDGALLHTFSAKDVLHQFDGDMVSLGGDADELGHGPPPFVLVHDLAAPYATDQAVLPSEIVVGELPHGQSLVIGDHELQVA